MFGCLVRQTKLSRSVARGVATAVLVVLAGSRCAIYEKSLTEGMADGPQGGDGAGGESSEGGKPSGGGAFGASGSTSGAAPGGQQNGGSPPVAGSAGSVEPGEGGAGGAEGVAEGGAPSEGGQGPSGGVGGTGATAGMAGMAGMAGVEVLLSQGKAATADSQQTSQDHLASHANDGDTSTRWCAADSALNHYWQVDLGQSRTLTKVHLLWEKDFAYLFKIETSADGAIWSMAIDRTSSSDAVASQDHAMPANTTGRYVRLTVTGGLQATTWASLYEVQIFGY